MSSLLRYYAELQTYKMEECWGITYTEDERAELIEVIIEFESGHLEEEALETHHATQPSLDTT